MKLSVTVSGIPEIRKALSTLPDALNHKIVGQLNVAAAAPLIAKEKLLAPEGPTGNLVDSIGAKKTSAAKAASLGEVIVGPRRGGRFKGYIGPMVEKGTRLRRLKGRGKYRAGTLRGVMPAHPFVKPAFNITKKQILSLQKSELGRIMTRNLKRYLRGT